MPALLTQQQVDEIRRRTGAHETTILRRIAGLPVRGAAGVAIDRELAALGLAVAPRFPDRVGGGPGGTPGVRFGDPR